MKEKALTKESKVLIFIAIVSILSGFGGVSSYGYVKPVNSSNSTIVLSSPANFGDNDHKQWRSLGRYLIDSNYHTYIIKWRGDGGYLDQGKEFIQNMKRAQDQGKKIIFDVRGPVISMHALASCYADEVRYNGNYLLFHADGYEWNRINYKYTQNKSSIKIQLNHCIEKGLITTKDYNKLWEGYEVHTTKTKVWYVKDTRPIG